MAQHSYSKVKAFETCPRKFYETQILKLYPREDTEATLYGTQVHEQAELFIKDGRPLDPSFAFMQPVLDRLAAMPGRKFPELEMAVKETLEPCDFKAEDYWCRGIADLVIVDDENLTARVFDYKGLPLDTPIPVPGGFSTMGALKVGSIVFGSDGVPCRVTAKSRIHNKPCYEIVFDDGLRVVCDEDHRWATNKRGVVEAKNLRVGDGVPNAKPVIEPEATLPIDPYVLGVWLADGKHTSGEICKPDAFIWEQIETRGYALGVLQKTKTLTRTVLGLSSQLKEAGVLGNKHIPDAYLHASVSQRLDLLRGIMDGDGHANPLRKQAVLNTPNTALALQVKQLAESLGSRVYHARVDAKGFGKTFTSNMLSWRPTDFVPFLMPRKATVFRAPAVRSWYRRIRSITPTTQVPTQCISVDSPDNTYLCTRSYLVTHNTGGDKYPDTDQLMLMSLLVFKHFPHVRSVSSGLLFVVKNSVVKHRVQREQEAELWWRWRERVARIDAALYHKVFNPKQSGLCRKYCEVLDCSYNGRRRA